MCLLKPEYQRVGMSVGCIGVVIGDPSPLFLCGLMSVLKPTQGFNVIAAYTDPKACFKAIRDWSPKLALVDASLLGGALLVASRVDGIRTRFIVFAPSIDQLEFVATASPGSFGVVPKEIAPWSLLQYLRQAAAGKRVPPLESVEPVGISADEVNFDRPVPPLTEREHQVAQLISLGLSNKEIGRELSLAAGTVKIHLHRIYQKLAVHNRTALAVRNARAGEYVGPPSAVAPPLPSKEL